MPSTLFSRAAVAAAFAAAPAFLPAQCGIDPTYGTNLNLADDAVSPPQPLGFTFPFAGATYDSVCVSSNGFLYLFDTAGSVPVPTDPRCCNGNVGALLASASPMVCALWTDLNPSMAGAAVHFRAAPGRAYATFVDVPEFVASPGARNTFQITLHASGRIELHFDSNCEVFSLTLAGWSPGNGATNPGASNLSAVPFTTSSATAYEVFTAGLFDVAGRTVGATPNGATSWVVDYPAGCARTSTYGLGCRAFPALRLGARPLSRPVIGANFDLRLQDVSATAAGGLLVLGVTNPNLSLTFLGLPSNCRLLAAPDVMPSFATTSPTTIVTVPVPNSTALVNRSLHAQAIVVDPSLTGLPVALANGILLTFGA
jgi:hypothetical protein